MSSFISTIYPFLCLSCTQQHVVLRSLYPGNCRSPPPRVQASLAGNPGAYEYLDWAGVRFVAKSDVAILNVTSAVQGKHSQYILRWFYAHWPWSLLIKQQLSVCKPSLVYWDNHSSYHKDFPMQLPGLCSLNPSPRTKIFQSIRGVCIKNLSVITLACVFKSWWRKKTTLDGVGGDNGTIPDAIQCE